MVISLKFNLTYTSDINRTIKEIKFSSLKKLLAFQASAGSPIIINSNYDNSEYSIEVYDDYRE